ncbi:MAG: EAL domain-containing protein [Pseudomonadota bacterium]
MRFRDSDPSVSGKNAAQAPQQMLERVYEHTSIGVYRTSMGGEPLFASPALVRMMGYETEEEWAASVSRMDANWYVDPSRRATFIKRIIEDGCITNFESEIYVHRTGETIWVTESASVINDEAGEPAFFEGIIEDITERKLLEIALETARQKAERLSQEDAETGLPNRRALEYMIMHNRCAEDKTGVAAFVIRRFTDIQSAVGYEEANRLVNEVASRISQLFPEGFIARIDERTLATSIEVSDFEAALETLSAIVHGCARPVILSRGAIDVQLVGGLAPIEETSDINIIDRARIAADQSMEKEQEAGVFDSKAYGDPTETLSLMTEMIAAMDSGDFYVVYQPKYEIRTGRINGLEALARWNHYIKGPISPSVFIPAAEATGRISVMTEWMIRKIIEEQQTMRACGIEARISINISGRLLNDKRFVHRTLDILKRTDAHLCFEVTETMVIQNPKQALETIRKFRDRGISISIDDYGTGLSSLSYLKQIPAHELKIDRTFVKDLLKTASDRLLVKSTIDLAHALGMTVVAEGIEDFGTLRALAGLGADEAQGFCISHPHRLDHWVDNVGAFPKRAEEVRREIIKSPDVA